MTMPDWDERVKSLYLQFQYGQSRKDIALELKQIFDMGRAYERQIKDYQYNGHWDVL